MKKVAFLDRDGVINVDLGYVNSQENFSFVDGAIEAMRRIISLGYEIVIVTNQSGIGRGLYSVEQYQALTSWYLGRLLLEGVDIKDVLYCPHYMRSKIAGYAVDCNCRKPKSGMFDEAVQKHSINLLSSFVVGDKLSDLVAGARAGLHRGYLVRNNYQVNSGELQELNLKGFEYTEVSDLANCSKLLERE